MPDDRFRCAVAMRPVWLHGYAFGVMGFGAMLLQVFGADTFLCTVIVLMCTGMVGRSRLALPLVARPALQANALGRLASVLQLAVQRCRGADGQQQAVLWQGQVGGVMV